MIFFVIIQALVYFESDEIDRLVEVARENCKTNTGKLTHETMRQMVEEEIAAGIPENLRGAVLAAACHESGYNPQARGDCIDGKRGKHCRAVGVLQLWNWAKIERTDPVASARRWTKQIAFAVRRAKRRKCRKPWITAWNWVATGPFGWRCDRVPNHVRTLRRFQRIWRAKN